MPSSPFDWPGWMPAEQFPGADEQPLEYPGTRPSFSYCYFRGTVFKLGLNPDGQFHIDLGSAAPSLKEFLEREDAAPLPERFIILAVGSNACPGRFDDLDSVYAAGLAPYAAIPASCVASRGTVLDVWATLLSREQLKLMNVTEEVGIRYDLVKVAGALRIGPWQVEPVYAYFHRGVLVLDGKPVRLEEPAANQSRFASMNQRKILTAVLDRIGLRPELPLEKRHRLLWKAAKEFDQHERDVVERAIADEFQSDDPILDPGDRVELKDMLCGTWQPLPGTRRTDVPLRALVHPTEDRRDAGRGFIRLTKQGQKKLRVRTGDYVVVGGRKYLPGRRDKPFEVLAAVGNLFDRKDAGVPPEFEEVQLDMTLREATGVTTWRENPELAEVTLCRPRKIRSWRRRIRDSFAGVLGYQYVVCRVQKAFSADMETSLCRTSSATIQNLGLKEQGVVVIRSAHDEELKLRVLPLPEKNLPPLGFVQQDTPDDEIGPLTDFDRYLGLDVESGRRVPNLHLDRESRHTLGVAAGQPVWVRRAVWPLLEEKLRGVVYTVVLALVTFFLKDATTLERMISASIVLAIGVIPLLLLAVLEIRNSVR
jgi:hypothetical protein